MDKFMNTWIRRSSFRGLSIQQRLPLLICVLLLCVVIAFTLVSYFGIRNATLQSGRDRLNSLSDQLGSILSQSAQNYIAGTKVTANSDSVRQCVKSPGPAICLSARGALRSILRQDTMTVYVALLDLKKRKLQLAVKDSIHHLVNFDSLTAISTFSDAGTFGKIHRIRDSVFYPVIVPVVDGTKTIGHLVRWKIIAGNPKSVAQFSQLLGTNANLYVGNADGSIWTDMTKPVPDPIPASVNQSQPVLEYSHTNGDAIMAIRRQIRGTEWSVLIEFSRQSVLETSTRFLTSIIVIGTIIVIVGILIAWIMSMNITRPLNRLTAAVSEIASGRNTPAVPVDRRDEVGKLARAFNAMSVQVTTAKENLEQKVIEAEQMSEQLRNLSAHLQNVREQERIHIAREMHDELGQLLTGFKMDVAWLNRRMNNAEDPAVKEKLESLMQLADDAVSFVRRLSAELRPSILDDLGLVPALQWHSKEFQKRFNIDVEFHTRLEDISATDLVATGLFRMYQESLTNVARHSGAKKVVANLQRTSSQICLSITDDGKGFEVKGTGEKKTLGLLGMKERAIMIGGHLEIISQPGKGTTVIITVPLPVAVSA
jgi:signal transduction histidine kinase